MRKKLQEEELEEVMGPMNSVAKHDALLLSGVLGKETLEAQEERLVRAKKKKMVRSTLKHDRALNKRVYDVYANHLDK